METYRELMETTPSPLDHLHEGKPLTPGILGGPDFLDRLPRRVRMRFLTPDSPPSFDRIIAYVAKLYRVPVEDILSRRRQPTLVLVRAQIAWYATEHTSLTLAEVATHLNRDASTLSRMIYRHRHRQPQFFSLQVFQALRTSIEPEHVEGNAASRAHIALRQATQRVTTQSGNSA